MSASHAGSLFADRRQAGRQLAARILQLDAESHGLRGRIAHRSIIRGPAPPAVLALPRGGVPVAFEVAAALHAPLDVLLARKIGAPGNPELGMGAVAEGGVSVLSHEVLRGLLVSQEELERSVARAEAELNARAQLYRADRAPLTLEGRTAIVVDDGLATGGTARAAIRAAQAKGAGSVVFAAPVGAPSTVKAIRAEADEVICLAEPEPMWAIGMWYADFDQVPDEEVLALLRAAHERSEAQAQKADAAKDAFPLTDEGAKRPG